MKLATIKRRESQVAALQLDEDWLLDLDAIASAPSFAASGIDAVPADLMKILTDGKLEAVRAIEDWARNQSQEVIGELRAGEVIVGAESATYQAAVPRPSLILAQGLAYGKHLHEMGVPLPEQPVAFIKVSSSLTGSGCPIVLPPANPHMVDWEGEFAIVIGKVCHDVPEGSAMDYVAGYTIINDVSARDWTARALSREQSPMQAVMTWGDNIHGKQFPTFTPLGPVVVTSDEIGDPHNLQLTTRVNGQIMQDASTDDLIFSIPRLISHLSRWYLFRPGDVISTGSPSGVGYAQEPKQFLQDGDVVDITVTNVGTLSNPVVMGRSAGPKVAT